MSISSRASSGALELECGAELLTVKTAGERLVAALDELIAIIHSSSLKQPSILLNCNDTTIAARVWLQYFTDVESQLAAKHGVGHSENFELLNEILIDARDQVTDLVQALSSVRSVTSQGGTQHDGMSWYL
jgi:hypothetical protein